MSLCFFPRITIALFLGAFSLQGCAVTENATPTQIGSSVNVSKTEIKDISDGVWYGDVPSLKAWLNKGHHINEPSFQGNTLLCMSSRSYSKVKTLLAQGADPNALNGKGESPLGLSASSHFNVAQLLLNNGADPNLKDKNGSTPLKQALISGHLNTIQLLLDKGARFDFPIGRDTVIFSRPGIVKLLIDKGFPLKIRDDDGNSLIHLIQDVDILKILINKGIDPDIQNEAGESVLFSENIEKVKFFIDLNKNISRINNKKQSPIHRAAENGRMDLLEYWLNDQKENINLTDEANQSPLYLAVKQKHLHQVEYLLQKGADPNILTLAQDSSLLLSLWRKDFSIIQALLNKGANAKIRDRQGRSTLDLARAYQIEDLIPLLKQHGATD